MNMKTRTKYASAPDEANIRKLIAQFYCRNQDEVSLVASHQNVFDVKLGDKVMLGTEVIVARGRYYFVKREL